MYRVVKWIFSGLILTLANVCYADEAEEKVRSTILIRLPGLIYWSKESELNSANPHYRLCIYRDRDYFSYIRSYLKDSTIKGNKVEYRFVRNLSDLKGCHVSYLGPIEKEEVNQIIEQDLLKYSVFVASSEFSARLGLHIRLFVGEEETIQMEVNQAAFAKGGHEPSVKFIKFAAKVYKSIEGEKL